MKIAPIMRVFSRHENSIAATLLHTGQHYDAAMKKSFFEQLHIPEPDIDLGVGSGSHAVQTAEIMLRFEPILDHLQPTAVLVLGDVNSTISCALVAVKKGIPVIHVEAGLRSYDRGMPEEINRVLTDQISDLLFTTERSAENNLLREGIATERIHFVGNVMIDTLRYNLERAVSPTMLFTSAEHPIDVDAFTSGFGLVTLHRPSNVDNPVNLERLLKKLRSVSEQLPLAFPVHPRTAQRMAEFGLESLLDSIRILRLPPQGYLQMLGMMKEAKLVLTDSGGIQEETTALGVPCITLRENTERPITADEGTNTVVGTDPEKIQASVDDVLATGGKRGRIPEYWDGLAAERLADVIIDWTQRRAFETQAAG